METWVPLAVAAISLIMIIAAAIHRKLVLSADPGAGRVQDISRLINQGALIFIRAEYLYVAVFAAIMVAVISVALRSSGGWMTALCYILGTLFSLAAGYVALSVATRSNGRTAQAARSGSGKALSIVFHSGAVAGFLVAGLGLLGLTVCYLIFQVWLGRSNAANIIVGFSLGASTVALFARVGGGIFNKAGDMGADLLAASEGDVLPDEERNSAFIAEHVGDNVGEVAGMGADLFESYVAAIVAPIAIAASGVVSNYIGVKGMLLPLAIAGFGSVCCLLGSLFVRTGREESRAVQNALIRPTYIAFALATAGSFFLIWGILGWQRIGLFWSVLMGILAGIVIALTSEYFTSRHFRPVQKIAENAQSGAGFAVIRGLSAAMFSVAAPVGIVAVSIGVSFYTGNRVIPGGGGLYGIGLAALGMLCTTAMIVAVDATGPVADNACGIAELAGMDQKPLEVTHNLDSIGNTAAAIGKGFAIGSAALAALALIAAYAQVSGLTKANLIGDYKFIVGILLGALTPFVFSALTLDAVLRAASSLVEEVRRQFGETAELPPDEEAVALHHQRSIEMTVHTSVRNMVPPVGLAVIAPLLIGAFLGVESLAGFLTGALATGFIMATMMANAGGAWENAKRYVESGALGGKGSATHLAMMVADTVADPFKDTSGPSLNILIKVMAVVSLLFVPLFK